MSAGSNTAPRLCRCGGLLGLHPTVILCLDCRAASPRDRVERWQTLAGQRPPTPQPPCLDCGRPVERLRSGHPAVRCQACRRARADAKRARWTICALAGCGQAVRQPPGTHGCLVRYCCEGHHQQAKAVLRNARRKPAAAPRSTREVTCALASCGQVFTTEQADARFCCWQHRRQDENQRRILGPERVAAQVAQRKSAAQVAKARAATERCPDCTGALATDASLLYCRSRCGWSVLVKAS